mmetsp:Transcript_77106/g.136061  ORF Transcript_77106/g.136061 Transcript_77106/m.136061 type:complete len:262 (+) Transcript_77106:76-861(+)
MVGPIVPVSSAMRRRSVELGADPSFREMKHFVGSHQHDERLIAAADLRKGLRDGLPKDWRDDVEVLRQTEAAEDNTPLPLQSLSHVDARLEWRQKMDRQMRRLLQDTKFALDDRLPEDAKHELRCGHTDRMHEWYGVHGMKQARKEREAPSNVRFNAHDPVMPGSLRTASKTHLALPGASIRTVSVGSTASWQSSRPSSRSSSTGRTLASAGQQAVEIVASPKASPKPTPRKAEATSKMATSPKSKKDLSSSSKTLGRWEF